MALSDKALGGLMLVIASTVFVYYTIWTIFLPLVPSSNAIHDLFPAREWAIRIPAFLLVVGLSMVGLFVGFVVLKEKQKKTAKLAVKTA